MSGKYLELDEWSEEVLQSTTGLIAPSVCTLDTQCSLAVVRRACACVMVQVQANYSRLLNCATWRWAVVHPLSGEPLVREAERDFCREYSIMVDERPVAIQMHYDWGCWCYLIYKVGPTPR